MESHICNRMEVWRYVAPTDFLFKIQSFSSLLTSTTKEVLSGTFESGGYYWRLRLSLKGTKKNIGADHISLYLSLVDTTMFESGWEIPVNCKLFLLNQIEDNYLSVEDGKVWRFSRLKTEWGLDQLLAMSSFFNPTNGYLVDDCCIFGAEIYIIRPNNATIEALDLSKTLQSRIFTWKITDYTKSETKTIYLSPEFIIGGWKWNLELHPNGERTYVGSRVSLFLCFNDSESLGNSELEARCKLRIKDRVSGRSIEANMTKKFSPSQKTWGYTNFMSSKDVKDVTKGYLLDNTLVVEVEIYWLSKVKEIKIFDVPIDSAY